MQTVVIGLVMVAVAFPAGWLLCRAWMAAQQPAGPADSIPVARHHKMLRTQRSRYRRRVLRIHEVVRKHEETRDQIRDKLTRLQHNMQADSDATAEREAELERARQNAATLKTALEDSKKQLKLSQSAAAKLESQLICGDPGEAASHNEMDMLRIERDELSARVRRLKLPVETSEDEAEHSDEALAELRAQLGETRETLSQREHRIRELERQLEQRDLQLEEMETTVNSWKRRVTPLARQVQNQREIIRRARAGEVSDDAELAAAAEIQGDPDDLQRIRGVGPALERRLIANGVRHFEQLALLSEGELRELADKLAISPALPLRDAWAEQAQSLHDEQLLATA